MCRPVSVKCYLPANKRMPYTSAAAAPGWWAGNGTICGAFLTDYAPVKCETYQTARFKNAVFLKDGALSLQTSLSHRELPPRAPACTWQRFVLLCTVRVLLGEVFCVSGGRDFLRRAASHSFGGRGAFRGYALHECRDSACRRPFGVRLRGNDWFRRSPLHRCAAPLRMTQWVCRIVGCNLFVIMLL